MYSRWFPTVFHQTPGIPENTAWRGGGGMSLWESSCSQNISVLILFDSSIELLCLWLFSRKMHRLNLGKQWCGGKEPKLGVKRHVWLIWFFPVQLYWLKLKVTRWDVKMAQWDRTCPILEEDPSSFTWSILGGTCINLKVSTKSLLYTLWLSLLDSFQGRLFHT